MTLQQLNNAVNACNAGLIEIPNGEYRAFLFNSNWYPLRAVVKYAINAGNGFTTNDALKELAFCLDYINVKRIHFQGHPVGLVQQERINQINILKEMIIELQNQ